MAKVVLGLDIGGANLKAATSDGRALSVPFAVWKHPAKLGEELAKLIGQFPETTALAVTMTAELCDCYETKREGVNKILDAVEFANNERGASAPRETLPMSIWSTAGQFVAVEEARTNHMTVAAANWHALATYSVRHAANGTALLIDMGSTTTDLIPIIDGKIAVRGLTDHERLANQELIYLGIRRTPLCAMTVEYSANELFATTDDIYIFLGKTLERPSDTDTADGRPATRKQAWNRLAHMLGGDYETISETDILEFAKQLEYTHIQRISDPIYNWTEADGRRTYILSGSGEFLVRQAIEARGPATMVSLKQILGQQLSAAAPAYAVAVLASEAN